ncbi:MAG: hypothetical protein WC536_03490 [Patescibacteria group bacterium]
MKDRLSINKSWRKHRIPYIIASTITVILIIAGIGLAYSIKNNLSQKEAEVIQKDNLDNSTNYDQSTTMDEELQKIDTEIESNRSDNSGNGSSIDTDLGL